MTANAAKPHRALVTGHFSTVGDIEVLRQVEDQLRRIDLPYEISPLAQERVGMDPSWVRADSLDPSGFTHLLLVCGPYAPDFPAKYPEVLGRFRHCTQIGINLTMVAPLASCDPFDALLERDSDRMARPDLSFLHEVRPVPVVGLCLVRRQREYGARQRHDQAADRLRRLLARAGVAVIEIDTALPRSSNRAGIGSEAEFESICARLDALVTTRLHGTVLALKNGVPVLAVDAIAGRDKVSRQTALIGWPESFALEETSDAELDLALLRCLRPEARQRATECAERARALLAGWEADFAAALEAAPDPGRRPAMAPQLGVLGRWTAQFRKWKRRRFPRRR